MIWGVGGGQVVFVCMVIQNGICFEQIYFVIWLVEIDVVNVGLQMKGVKWFEVIVLGMDYLIIQCIQEKVIMLGKGVGEIVNVGNSYYNFGVVIMVVVVEVVWLGVEVGGLMNGDVLKVGFEKILGYDVEGLMFVVIIIVIDYQGGGVGCVLEWDGEKWVFVFEWYVVYFEIVCKVIEDFVVYYGK